MKTIFLLIFILIASTTTGQFSRVEKGILPAHRMSFYDRDINNFKNETCFIEVNTFEISDLITFKQYSMFLKEVKKDSTKEYYDLLKIKNVQTKNTSFKFKPTKTLPVVNLNWLQANEYCKWLTATDENFNYTYQLPNIKQWFYCFNNSELLNFNFPNKLYSEWLFNTKNETPIDCENSQIDFSYPLDFDILKMDSSEFIKQFPTKALLRKHIVGTSWMFPNAHNSEMYKYYYFSFYANEGYPSVGFRVVRIENKTDTELKPIINIK